MPMDTMNLAGTNAIEETKDVSKEYLIDQLEPKELTTPDDQVPQPSTPIQPEQDPPLVAPTPGPI